MVFTKNSIAADRRGASVNVTMMTIAIIGLLIPAIFAQAIEVRNHNAVEYLSIGVAIALILTYVLGVIFSFRLPNEEKHALPGEVTTDEQIK